jgi:hypothetical protein
MRKLNRRKISPQILLMSQTRLVTIRVIALVKMVNLGKKVKVVDHMVKPNLVINQLEVFPIRTVIQIPLQVHPMLRRRRRSY